MSAAFPSVGPSEDSVGPSLPGFQSPASLSPGEGEGEPGVTPGPLAGERPHSHDPVGAGAPGQRESYHKHQAAESTPSSAQEHPLPREDQWDDLGERRADSADRTELAENESDHSGFARHGADDDGVHSQPSVTGPEAG